MQQDGSSQSNTALAPRTRTIDQMIQVWLQEKANRTRSVETRRAYSSRLAEFRAALRATALDLDCEPQLVALAAQGWAAHTDRVDTIGTPVAVASTTYNQRLPFCRASTRPPSSAARSRPTRSPRLAVARWRTTTRLARSTARRYAPNSTRLTVQPWSASAITRSSLSCSPRAAGAPRSTRCAGR